MRETLRFYVDCFLWAFPRSWGVSETISAAVGLFLPILVKLIPEMESKLTDLLWQIPLFALATVFLVRFIRAPYELYKREKQGAEKTEQELRDTISQLETKASATDWKDLADRFKETDSFVTAHWYEDRGEATWQISPGDKQGKEYASLCELAGSMLTRSPKVCAMLPDKVRSKSDPIERWLEFLKERGELHVTGHGVVREGEGQETRSILLGSIENLPGASRQACIHCAACET